MDDLTASGSAPADPGPGARQRVLMLGGAGRSGTTILERVIGRLPGVAPLGEARYLWERGVLADQRCGCGQPFGQCPFWTAVGMRAFGGWATSSADEMVQWRDDNDRARRIPALIRAHGDVDRLSGAREYAQSYARVYRAAADLSDADWVVDSSKHVSMPYAVSLSEELDVRVLQLVRDPRGVAYSWRKSVVRPEITEHVELMPQYSSRDVATTWVVHNLGLAALPRLGVPLLRMRYEDVVADPLGSLTAIAAFLAAPLPADLAGELADGRVELGPSHTVAGNPMRFRLGEFRLERDSAWESGLPARDKRLVSGLAGPLLLHYGYSLSARSRDVGA